MGTNFKKPTESLQHFLDLLSKDSEKAAVEYNRLHGSLTRFFVLKGENNANKAADETLDRVMKKIGEGAKIEDLQKYCFGVARFVFMERIRSSKKEAEAIKEFYENETVRKNDSEETDSFRFLRECFGKLNISDKGLLQKYFADISFSELNKQREKICLDEGISLNNLRLKIFRLRKRLEDCVKNKLK